jgi:hypothetical protein
VFILEPSEQAKAAIGKRVTVVDYRSAGRLKGDESSQSQPKSEICFDGWQDRKRSVKDACR